MAVLKINPVAISDFRLDQKLEHLNPATNLLAQFAQQTKGSCVKWLKFPTKIFIGRFDRDKRHRGCAFNCKLWIFITEEICSTATINTYGKFQTIFKILEETACFHNSPILTFGCAI